MLLAACTLALRDIRRHPARSTAAVLGIVIGVATGVMTATLGRDASEAVRERIAQALHTEVRLLATDLGVVAAVAVLIGGAALTKTMLASVTARRGEIGMRLAVGARGDQVLMQFLLEAVTLSCVGGLVGLVVAFGSELVAALLIHIPVLFDAEIALAALVISALIGAVFGYVPARRAAALNPIDALTRSKL